MSEETKKQAGPESFTGREVKEEDINAVLKLLDNFSNSEESRFKVVASAELEAGSTQKQYHHGRCDIGSPWAKGTAFDVLE